MLSVEFVRKLLILSLMNFDFSLFTEKIMSTKTMTKLSNSISWVGFKIDLPHCIRKPGLQRKLTEESLFFWHCNSLSVGRVVSKYD